MVRVHQKKTQQLVLEQWLELNTTFSAQWPNVTRKLDQTPPDADAMKGVDDKPAPRVSLVWVTKDGRALAESIGLPSSRNADASDFTMGLPSFDVQAYETRPTTDRGAEWPRARAQGWDFTQGRPDIWASIAEAIPATASKPLLFGCGPAPFVKDAVYAAQKQRPNVLIHTETFEL